MVASLAPNTYAATIMNIAPLIKKVARGKHGSAHLSRGEAANAFAALLAEDADPLQLGAFLIAQRMKGESSRELAGFVDAARSTIADYGNLRAPDQAVDLPCYAGKRRAPHAYLAAAFHARDAGIPILIHGVSEIGGRVSAWQVLQQLGVRRATTLAEASAMLQAEGMAYIDLAELSPALFHIYHLRGRLGVRSFANTVARLLNPLACAGSLNGFFHTPYADYMANANIMLAQPRSLIFMGAEGEPELYADRQKLIIRQTGDQLTPLTYPPAGLDPYPKTGMNLSLLEVSSCRMIREGFHNAREAAVIERMREAFHFAAFGRTPAAWRATAEQEEEP